MTPESELERLRTMCATGAISAIAVALLIWEVIL